jgi:hypothetical protein
VSEDQARSDFRAHLVASGQDGDTADEVAATINLDAFTVDGNIDTEKLNAFAQKYNLSLARRRNFGAGVRGPATRRPVAPGRAEAERRFGNREQQGQGEDKAQSSTVESARPKRGGGQGRAEAERRYGTRS